jgi:hypothetical protein
MQSAFALDSVLTEILFVLGPLFVALLVAVADAGVALLASAVAVTAGTILFLVVLPTAGEEQRAGSRGPRDPLGALRSPGIRTLALAMIPVGFAFGALEVAIPAFADEEGRPELAGVLLAVWAMASVAGGLAYGARPRRASLTRVHLRMALLLPLGLVPVALATSPVVMALFVLPAGIFIAPLLATRNELAGQVAPAGSRTEAVTWPLTALVSGIALGAASAGALIDASGCRHRLGVRRGGDLAGAAGDVGRAVGGGARLTSASSRGRFGVEVEWDVNGARVRGRGDRRGCTIRSSVITETRGADRGRSGAHDPLLAASHEARSGSCTFPPAALSRPAATAAPARRPSPPPGRASRR